MKKILLALVALFATIAVEAKIIKITRPYSNPKVYTSTQLSSIEFNEDGTISIYDYNNELLATLNPAFDELTIGDEEEVFLTTTRTISTADMSGMLEQESYKGFVEIMTKEFGMDLGSLMSQMSEIMPASPREVQQIMFYYPTVDPYGNPVTQSGCITIPTNIVKGQDRSEGVILFHHFTTSSDETIPSKGYMSIETMLLANPLNPNYILVQPDNYGLGATARFPQAFIQGDANGQPSIDCLLAAERILKKRNINRGKLTFNAGYSSGGFEALAALKARDMHYADQVHFDKTFAGGSPTNMNMAYDIMAAADTLGFNAVLPVVMVATNETQKLGETYDNMFQPWFAEGVEENILSKKHELIEMEDPLWRKRLHDFIMPAYLDTTSPQSQSLKAVLQNLRMMNGWKPDPSQNLYIVHVTDDDVVPMECAQELVSYLVAGGYTPSSIPFQTNLEVNLSTKSNMPVMTHVGSMLYMLIQFMAETAAWPEMYVDGQLRPEYQAIVDGQSTDPETILAILSAMGYDIRGMVYHIIAQRIANSQDVTTEAVVADLSAMLAARGINVQDITSLLSLSGLDADALLANLVSYLIGEYNAEHGGASARMLRAAKVETPVDQYKQQMDNWVLPALDVVRQRAAK